MKNESIIDSKSIILKGYRAKKDRNLNFSIRSWAKQLGLSSHGTLQQVLNGKRLLPKKHLPLIIKSLDLSKKDSDLLETLLDIEKSKSQEEKELHLKKLENFNSDEFFRSTLEVENFKYFENPLHSIIRTMIDLKGFKNSPSWIQKKLRIKTYQDEIKEIIIRLISLGLVEENNGILKKSSRHISNKIDTPNKAVQKFHERTCLLAATEVHKQSVDEREFNSFCMNIDPKKLSNAKQDIRKFISDFIDEYEVEPNKSKSTYQLNLNFFSLTKGE